MMGDSSEQLPSHNNEEFHDCSSREILRTIFKNIEELYEPQRMVTGISTGFSDLDIMTTGLRAGDLIIVAGRPGMGKTAFAQSIVQHAAMHDIPERLSISPNSMPRSAGQSPGRANCALPLMRLWLTWREYEEPVRQ